MASTIMQWDGSDGTTVESHLAQMAAYFVAKELKDEDKKVACLHLSLRGEPKKFL